MIRIDRPEDARLDDVRKLTDVPFRRRWEDEHEVLVAEGPKVVDALLRSPHRTRMVLATPARAASLRSRVPAGVPLYVAEPDVIAAVVGFDLSRGVVAAADRPAPSTVGAVAANARRMLVIEDVNDAVNLGALFRTGRALGVDGVVLSRRCTDPLYRRTVRVSMGHVLHVPFARADDLPETLAELDATGMQVVALTPRGGMPLDQVPRSPRVAVVVGAEGPGLTDEVVAAATVRARIPMADGVDSLNVAVAAGIALHALG